MADGLPYEDAQLAALLAELPQVDPPAGLEARLRRRLQLQPRRHRSLWVNYTAAALAGACLVLLAVTVPQAAQPHGVTAPRPLAGLPAPAIQRTPAQSAPAAAPAAGAFAPSGVGSAASSAAIPVPPRPGGSFSTALPDLAERKIIQQASLTVEVDDIQQGFDRINQLVTGLGGFVGQSSFSQGDEGPTASLDLRVPTNNLSAVLDQVRGLGKVTGATQSARDVTEQYIDVTARIDALRQEEAAYLRLLAQAKTVDETVRVQQALTQVRSQIESWQGQQQSLQHLSDLATVHVSLTTAGRPKGALASSWRAFVSALTDLVIGVVWLLPWAAAAAVVAAVVLAVRRRRIVR